MDAYVECGDAYAECGDAYVECQGCVRMRLQSEDGFSSAVLAVARRDAVLICGNAVRQSHTV